MKNPAAIREFITEGRKPNPWTQGFQGGLWSGGTKSPKPEGTVKAKTPAKR